MPVKAKERVAEIPKVAAKEYIQKMGYFVERLLGYGGAYSAYLADDHSDLPEGEDGGGEGGGQCP